jgi:protocatechuate 3,4-dioxygenase beta subunit
MKTLIFAIAVLLPLAQTPPAGPRAETASIRGRITDKVSGEPIARAIVSASLADGRSRATATLTDADGRYSFPTLVPGRYFIRAEPPPFRATYVGASYTRTTSSTEILTLKTGDEVTSIDIALSRGYAIIGRVVDVDGEPAARVRIVARPIGASGGGRGPDRETDDLGRFRIFGLLPGRYAVCSEFFATGSMQVRSALEQPVTTCYPSAPSSVEGRPVEVKSADVDGIEIRLLRTRTFTVSGTVLDSNGRPAENGRVSLEKHIAGGSSSTGIGGGPDGRFVMRNITPGDYTINASIGGPNRPAERRELEVASIPITVGSADVDVVLTMSRTVTIPGRIVFEGVPTPPPRDPGYGPMIVFAKFPDGVERSSVPTSTTVDEGMTFHLPDMYGPRVLDVVNIPSGWVLKSITYKGKDVTDAVADLQAGGEPGTIEVVMHNRGAVVTGRVVDDGGKPVRARVVMIPADRLRWLGFHIPVTALSSATAGTYAFRSQRAGEYAIVAIDQAEPFPSEQKRAFFERILKSGQTITIAENERRVVDLRVSKLVEDR